MLTYAKKEEGMLSQNTIASGPSPQGRGYSDGEKGMIGVPPHEEPKNKVQKEENRQYKEGWKEGNALFRKKRKG